jgi:hypothetical protein
MSDEQSDGSENEVEVVQPPQKKLKLTLSKPEKQKFTWTLPRKITMAKIVLQKNGHLAKAKDGLKKAQRWEAILLALQKQADFADLDINAKSLMNKFAEESEKVLKSCGVTKQSVNLSGFANEPPEYEKLMLEMAEEAEKRRSGGAFKAKQKKAEMELLASITANKLAGQKLNSTSLLPSSTSQSTNSSKRSTASADELTEGGSPDVPNENEVPPIANKVDYLFTTLSRAIDKLGETGEPTAAEKETIRAQKNMADYYEFMLAKERAKDL